LFSQSNESNKLLHVEKNSNLVASGKMENPIPEKVVTEHMLLVRMSMLDSG
jgi:hypothetical protein